MSDNIVTWQKTLWIVTKGVLTAPFHRHDLLLDAADHAKDLVLHLLRYVLIFISWCLSPITIPVIFFLIRNLQMTERERKASAEAELLAQFERLVETVDKAK